jgi:hypothetical protein
MLSIPNPTSFLMGVLAAGQVAQIIKPFCLSTSLSLTAVPLTSAPEVRNNDQEGGFRFTGIEVIASAGATSCQQGDARTGKAAAYRVRGRGHLRAEDSHWRYRNSGLLNQPGLSTSSGNRIKSYLCGAT